MFNKCLFLAPLALSAVALAACPARAQRTPIQIRRATTAAMPTLLEGQPAYATDTNLLWIGWGGTNRILGGRILVAAGAPSAILGNLSDTYFNSATGDMYQKNASGWNLVANFKGATGAQGVAGGQGIQGLQGIQGIAGINGTNGTNGISPVLSIGTVTALYTSAVPTATMGGTSSLPTLNLALPASGFSYIGAVPAIAVAEIGTNKTITITFPAAFPDTNYIFFVQFMNAGGLVNSLSWTLITKSATGMTITVKSNVAILAGSTEIWLFAVHKNTS